MADALEVVTKFTSDTSGLDEGAKKAGGLLSGVSNNALLMGAGVVAGAGIAISAIAGMTEAAMKDADEQAKLEQAIKAAGAATATSTEEINKAIEAGQAKAFSDTETRDALQSLVTATGSVTESTALLTTAQDLARFAGVDLATAADAVAKAQAGQDGAIRKLVPGLEKGKTATDTLANAQKMAAGQADLFASSTEGSMAIASDSFGELQETIGSAFIPIVKAIVPALVPVIKTLGQLIEAILPVLIPLIEVLAAAIKIVVDVLVILLGWVVQIVKAISAQLAPVLTRLLAPLKDVGGAFDTIVSAIRGMIEWIGRAIDAVGNLLDKLNPLKGFTLPSLPFSLAAPLPEGLGVSSRAGRSGGRSLGGSTVIVNVHGNDPEAVVRALRRWGSVNGGSRALTRVLDRASS